MMRKSAKESQGQSMDPLTNQFAFVTAPLAVTARSSSFRGLCNSALSNCTLPVRTRRCNRAHIIALGGAPPPPPSQPGDQSEDENPSEDEGEPKDEGDVNEEKMSEEVTADDILNSPAFLKKKLELIQKELIVAKDKLEKEEETLNNEKQRYVRLAADFENYRRRSMEDLRQQDSRSTAKVCKEILGVLDNFERATAAVDPQSEKERTIMNSYQSINKQLLDSLVKLKVEPIDAVGQVFDPEVHEAIQRLDSNEYVEDVVCQQYSRGYKIGDTLIRAAVVGVSVGPGPENDGNDGGEDESEVANDYADGIGAKAKEVGQQAADGL